ncbi:MAG: DUF1836 domain-containing protein [Clostridiales bacterium]|nr:DUF1836 domain-containing protein [Clostridiales bacterium]
MKIELGLLEKKPFPKWEELPDIPLYMDQVILLLEQALKVFIDEEKTITPAMVNNYVKHGLLSAPVKKKYDKKHVVILFIISVCKRVLSINEIVAMTKALIEEWGEEKMYTLFCEKLEGALQNVFLAGKIPEVPLNLKPDALPALDAALISLAGKLYVQSYVDNQEKEKMQRKDDIEK